jgi:hypothetical protein
MPRTRRRSRHCRQFCGVFLETVARNTRVPRFMMRDDVINVRKYEHQKRILFPANFLIREHIHLFNLSYSMNEKQFNHPGSRYVPWPLMFAAAFFASVAAIPIRAAGIWDGPLFNSTLADISRLAI